MIIPLYDRPTVCVCVRVRVWRDLAIEARVALLPVRHTNFYTPYASIHHVF